MISALSGTSNLLHSIGNGFVNNQQNHTHNNSLNCTNGRSYQLSSSPHSSSSDSTSPQLNVNTSLNSSTSANSSNGTNHNNSNCNSANNSTNSNQSTNGILSINKNMNNTDRRDSTESECNLNLNELGLNGKNSALSAFYANNQSLLNHNLIAAYHEQNGRRNSSDDHEEENNINNLNSLINQTSKSTDKLETNSTSLISGFELMDKCSLNNHFSAEKSFGHLAVNSKQTLSEQDCAALSATLEKANRLFEENLSQSNSFTF